MLSGIVLSSLIIVNTILAQDTTDRVRERVARQEDFRSKLQEIRDERKQSIVSNLSERFSNLNQKWTMHWTDSLSRLTEILSKIESRANELAANGVDTSEVSVKIRSAQFAIDTAQTAVDEQAVNNLEIDFSSEATLGEDIRGIISAYKEDMRSTFELIKVAKTAVREAFTSLKQLAANHEQ